MSICQYCGKEVLKRNLPAHYRTISCQQFQPDCKAKKLTYREIEMKYNNMEIEYEKMKTRFEIYESMYDKLQIEYEKIKVKCELYESFYGKLEAKNDEEHKDTKKILVQLASKPTVTTHNTQNNVFQQLTPLDLSEERIKNALPEYTMPHYLRGAEGMVEFLKSNLLTDSKGHTMYPCNDKNRGYFQYKNLDGEKVEDIKCQKLIASVKPHLQPQVLEFKKLHDEEIMRKYGDEDESYMGNENLISKKQKENRRLRDEAFEIVKYMAEKSK